MYQPDAAANWIDDKNRATIRDVNAKVRSRLIRDEAVTSRETFIGRGGLVDHSDTIAVNLLRCQQWTTIHRQRSADLAMCCVESRKHLRFVIGNFDSGDAPDESVAAFRNGGECGKSFDRRRTRLHYFAGAAWTLCAEWLALSSASSQAKSVVFSGSSPSFSHSSMKIIALLGIVHHGGLLHFITPALHFVR